MASQIVSETLINPMGANGGSNGFESQNAAGNTLKLKIVIPSRELTYPTWGKGKSSTQKCLARGSVVSSLEGVNLLETSYLDFAKHTHRTQHCICIEVIAVSV